MGCGVGHRCNLYLELLLWCRPAAKALFQPLAWELPSTTGVALKRQGEKKKKNMHVLNSYDINAEGKVVSQGHKTTSGPMNHRKLKKMNNIREGWPWIQTADWVTHSEWGMGDPMGIPGFWVPSALQTGSHSPSRPQPCNLVLLVWGCDWSCILLCLLRFPDKPLSRK